MRVYPVPCLVDNYAWLVVGDRGAAVVVDPSEAEPVREAARALGADLVGVLATHHHMDHVGGVEALASADGVPVMGPAREAIPGRTLAVGDGDRVDVPGIGLELEVLDVPGHTAGHVAYVGRGADWGPPVLFCGDTLFAAGCGRLFEGTADQMWSSLSALAALPGETRVYCAHEYTLANLRFAAAVEPANPAIAGRLARERAKRDRGLPTVPSTIAEERSTNPFLRVGEAPVRAIAEAHAGRRLDSDAAVFGALRDWKNAF